MWYWVLLNSTRDKTKAERRDEKSELCTFNNYNLTRDVLIILTKMEYIIFTPYYPVNAILSQDNYLMWLEKCQLLLYWRSRAIHLKLWYFK